MVGVQGWPTLHGRAGADARGLGGNGAGEPSREDIANKGDKAWYWDDLLLLKLQHDIYIVFARLTRAGASAPRRDEAPPTRGPPPCAMGRSLRFRLHIVAPEERREKVLREIKRPVFSLLEHGPLYEKCTFLSYDAVQAIAGMRFLAHRSDSLIDE